LREIEDARVSKLQQTPRGKLSISCPMSFGILHIAPAPPDFLAGNPDLSPKVRAFAEFMQRRISDSPYREPGQ